MPPAKAKTLEIGESIFASIATIVTAWLARDVWINTIRKPKPVFSNYMEGRVDVRELINRILQRTNFGRVLIFKTTNGGGLPHVGSHIYAKCLFEDFDGHYFQSVKDDYARVEADQHYEKMIIELAKFKKVEIRTEAMPPGLLRDIYEREGVGLSIVYFLHQTQNEFYYMSVAVHREQIHVITLDDVIKAKFEIDKIAYLYKKIGL